MKTHFRLNCELQYSVASPSEFVFGIQAAQTHQQSVLAETLQCNGYTDVRESFDPTLGNRFLRMSAARGPASIRYQADLLVQQHVARPADLAEVAVSALPGPVLPFLLPSRYCQSDRVGAALLQPFVGLPRGYARIEAVRDWVRQRILFKAGSSNWNTSALEVIEQKAGVCRDFAHVMITLLRALNVPARFVSGYDFGSAPDLGPTDFHAYVEAFVGDRWYLFDPSGLCPRRGLVRIATGRDASEVAFATIYGPVQFVGMKLSIAATDPASGPIAAAETPGIAVSSASLADGPVWPVRAPGGQARSPARLPVQPAAPPAVPAQEAPAALPSSSLPAASPAPPIHYRLH